MSVTMESEIKRFKHEYELLRGTEHAKNALIEVGGFCLPENVLSERLTSSQQLLTRLEQLNDFYQKELLDHERETAYNRDGQLREKKLYEELRKTKAETVRHLQERYTAV